MSILLDGIAAGLAELVRVVPTPTGDLGFGSDLDCADDLTADMAEIPGDSPLAIAQANYRRLITPRGALVDDPDYGLDVVAYLNKGLTVASLTQIPGQIKQELLKDDRNDTISVSMIIGSDKKSFSLDIRGETAEGPFTLTLAVADGVALVTEISGNGGVV